MSEEYTVTPEKQEAVNEVLRRRIETSARENGQAVWEVPYTGTPGVTDTGTYPREAFAALVERVGGPPHGLLATSISHKNNGKVPWNKGKTYSLHSPRKPKKRGKQKKVAHASREAAIDILEREVLDSLTDEGEGAEIIQAYNDGYQDALKDVVMFLNGRITLWPARNASTS